MKPQSQHDNRYRAIRVGLSVRIAPGLRGWVNAPASAVAGGPSKTTHFVLPMILIALAVCYVVGLFLVYNNPDPTPTKAASVVFPKFPLEIVLSAKIKIDPQAPVVAFSQAVAYRRMCADDSALVSA